MIILSVDTTELDQAVAKLQLPPNQQLTPLIPTLRGIADQVTRRAQQYPPERPGQRYRRTETLKRAWRRDEGMFFDGGFVVTVSNATPYAPFVQGDNQAWMHKGRWESVTEISGVMEPIGEAEIAANMDALIRGLGL